MENRLELLRDEVDRLIRKGSAERARYFTVHLYAVSHFCSLLAVRRGLDPELAAACGMLHDIHPVLAGDYTEHGIRGAQEAEQILRGQPAFSAQEVRIITDAISRHSQKEIVQAPYDEVLKDADVLHHCLYNPGFPIKEDERERFRRLRMELGCPEDKAK